jgi:hypothetical protein
MLHRPGELTSTGMVLGTVEYIAPEQGLGQAIDCRSDLYSVGVVMYRLLSGRLPFNAEHPSALIYHHVHTPPPPMSQVAPDVPKRLVAIVDRLLRKSAGERYQNAQEVLHDLDQFRDDHPDLKVAANFQGFARNGSIEAVAFREPPADSNTTNWTKSHSEVWPKDAPTAPHSSAEASGGARPRPRLIVGAIAVLLVVAAIGILVNRGNRPQLPANGLTGTSSTTQPIAAAPEQVVQPLPMTPDQRAAEWFLRLGGVGQVVAAQATRDVATAADLPQGPYRVVKIDLSRRENVNDEELAGLPSLSDLKELNLAVTKVTDAGVRAMPDLPRLQYLYLSQTDTGDAALESLPRYSQIHMLNLDNTLITDKGLSNVAALVQIEVLSMSSTSVSDVGVMELRKLPKLLMLGLNGTQVGDAGMDHVKNFTLLTHLHLSQTRLTDKGLKALTGLEKLTQLEVRDTRVTDEGVAAVKAALPGCNITR